jgi:drug/metabolite transporter (DMT)-like permease
VTSPITQPRETSLDLRRHHPVLGIVLKLSGVALVTALGAAVKSVGHTVPLGEVVFVRGGTSLLVILFLAWHTQRLSTLSLRKCFSYGPRTIFATLGTFALFAALSRGPLADLTAASFTMPIFATLFGMFSGERVHALRWSAVAAGFVGMLIMMGPHITMADASTTGILLALASAVCGALVSIFVRGMSRLEHPIAIAWYFAIPTTLAAAFTAIEGWSMPGRREWLVLGLIGLLGSGVQIVGNTAFRYAEVALLAPLDYTAIVLAVLGGYLLFDEVPQMSFWAGAPLLIFAGLLTVWPEYRFHRRLK